MRDRIDLSRKGKRMDTNITLSQKQTITPAMIQSMNILQMNTIELEHYIENIAMENPMMDLKKADEEYIDDIRQIDIERKLSWLESTDKQNSVYYKDDKEEYNTENNWRDIKDKGESLSDFLLTQLILHQYTRQEREIIEYIIQSLDNSGYFVENFEDIAGRFAVEEEFVSKLLTDVQKLDPAGVGARNLQECLLLQIHRQKEYSKLTESIIENDLDLVARNHLKTIAMRYSTSLEEVKRSCDEIRKLNPKPGNFFNDRSHFQYVSPDIVIVKFENHFDILINEYQYMKFQINPEYEQMEKTTEDAKVREYLREKHGQLLNIQQSIEYRSSTLSKVAHILVEKQLEFFLKGPGYRAPMKLADIASETKLHESTISRALHNKYLQCSWGVYPLNYFLTSVVGCSVDNKDEQTQEKIMRKIRCIIENEDKKKPLSDQKISEKLLEEKIDISRRTVNKYRKMMEIPDKCGRKKY